MTQFPEITWSLMHPTPLDPGYVQYLLEKAATYRVDSFEICGQCHSPYGGMDGLIAFEEYPLVHQALDLEKISENQRNMAEILHLSHAAGKKVYYFHREIMVMEGMTESIPDLLDENGEFDLLGKACGDLIRYKIRKTFEVLPDLDGLVLTFTEADFSAIHNSNTEKYPPVEVVRYIGGIFAEELKKRNKFFSIRSFGSIARDYECILAGVEKLSEAGITLDVETKITPYDFDPFLGLNPFLRKSAGNTLSVECECVGEFMGQGYMPFEHVHNLVRYVHQGLAAEADRFVIRMDRRGNCIFDLYEINYYAYDRALQDPALTPDEIRQEFYEKNYPPEIRSSLIELDRLGWEMVTKTYFLDQHVLFHGNYSMKYLKAAFVFSLFHHMKKLENGRGVWSILADRTSPGKCRIYEEK